MVGFPLRNIPVDYFDENFDPALFVKHSFSYGHAYGDQVHAAVWRDELYKHWRKLYEAN